MGMMPHPERASDPLMGSADGLAVFQSVLQAVGKGMTTLTPELIAQTPTHDIGIRQNYRHSGARAELYRAGHLQRDVERALLL